VLGRYAYDLMEGLGLDTQEGVVRVSLLHYNSMEEVDRMIGALDALFRRG
jgi:selenocysteine lyase/cysteine desulfurase